MLKIEEYYFCNKHFPNRYISPKKLFSYLESEYRKEIDLIGTSVKGNPIYKIRLGKGKLKVIAWSQMHGNESNATHALLDLLAIKKQNPALFESIFNRISLDFILMLNPDGSEVWKRRNAMDVDMNRDFHQEASKEFSLLKNWVKNQHYDYAFNLHEQRSVFSTDGEIPATICFLAPSEDIEKTITETRKQTMAVISAIYQSMKPMIPQHISRYNDDFYPFSTGDNFTKMGIPTILYEGGHFPEDYLRKETRKYYAIAFYYGLKAVAELQGSTENWEQYFDIPNNQETHFDIIYRNLKMNTDFPCVLDIAVQYEECIHKGDEEISFIPKIVEIGDLSHKKGWKEIDGTNKKITYTEFPSIGEKVNFKLK
ncbi:MAG: peptidase M14 [Flavobacteriales bacterium]|nr:MAG: peptidase M14 [Flavobacteriales bacterium]